MKSRLLFGRSTTQASLNLPLLAPGALTARGHDPYAHDLLQKDAPFYNAIMPSIRVTVGH